MVRATLFMEQHVGLYTYYINLRNYIDSTGGIEPTWVLVTYYKRGGFWERIPFLPDRVSSAFRGRAQVKEGIARTTSDVLFFNTQVPATFAHKTVRGRPYVISTDVTAVQFDRLRKGYGLRPRRDGLMQAYKHSINVRVLSGAARLLPWSRWVADSLVSDYGVDPEKIEVVPPGVDLGQWSPAQARAGGPVKILFVGAELERKGGLLLLQAFRALRDLGVELHLVTRERLPAEPGLSVYNDMRPNSDALKRLFAGSDIFCLPTLADCLPLVLCEAGAASLPSVATDLAAVPEIAVEGETGFLIDPGDVQGLIERLRTLVVDPELRRRMGRAARQHVERHYDARRNGERIVSCLREAAGA
jgi:glycosyltransferase involved in cell wall biosynthesis